MYTKSGHLPYYSDSMFPPMILEAQGPWNMMLQHLDVLLRDVESLLYILLKNRIPDSKTLQLEDPVAEAKKAIRATILQARNTLFKEKNAIPERSLTEQAGAFWDAALGALEFKDQALNNELTKIAKQRFLLSVMRSGATDTERVYLKAMNCPHHHKLFAAVPRSYRDLPLRLAEYGTCYRYEQSGELFGLMRVRSMQMNDAHIYCTPEQFEAEFNAVNEMYLKYFKLFGIEKYLMRFSTHDPSKLGQKFVNEPELWKQTEEMTRRVLKDSGVDYVEVPNEAAFYGPKIDVQVWSVIGREFTLATNQVDFAVPRRLNLVYRDKDNTEKTPICIHRAPHGTHERFIGFLIEHYAGNFPLWLAPEQVRVLTIGENEPLLNYAKDVVNQLRAQQVRAEGDYSNDPMKAKIAEAEKSKVHTMLVIGGRDMEAGNVSVRLHGKGNVGAKPKAEVIADILATIKERRS